MYLNWFYISYFFYFLKNTVNTHNDSFNFWLTAVTVLNSWIPNLLFVWILCSLTQQTTFRTLKVAPIILIFSNPTASMEKLQQELVTGLIGIHPIFFYFTLVNAAAVAAYSTYHTTYKYVCLYKEGFTAFTTGCLALLTGSYWSYSQTTWGFWWTWDSVELIILYVVSTVMITLHAPRVLYATSLVLYTLLSLILFLLLVRTGFVNSKHSFFEQSAYVNMGLYYTIILFIAPMYALRGCNRATGVWLINAYVVYFFTLKEYTGLRYYGSIGLVYLTLKIATRKTQANFIHCIFLLVFVLFLNKHLQYIFLFYVRDIGYSLSTQRVAVTNYWGTDLLFVLTDSNSGVRPHFGQVAELHTSYNPKMKLDLSYTNTQLITTADYCSQDNFNKYTLSRKGLPATQSSSLVLDFITTPVFLASLLVLVAVG